MTWPWPDSSNEYNLFDETLVCERRNIDAELDVDAFLSNIVGDIVFGQILHVDLPFQQSLGGLVPEQPLPSVAQLTESQCNLSQTHKLMVESFAELIRGNLAEVDSSSCDRVVHSMPDLAIT